MASPDYMPKSAAEARLLGAKTYDNGTPCIHGHASPRYTGSQCCTECKRLASIDRKKRSLTDLDLAETLRRYQREAKARRRSTPEGKAAHYQANKRYVESNRERVSAYYRTKRRDDPAFAMACWMRGSLHKVLKRANKRKDAKAVVLLGYTREQLKAHLEAQFLKGMGWHNRGEWQVDHIVPVAEHLRRGVTDPAVVNALSNLRPMWSKDNRAKSDQVTHLL